MFISVKKDNSEHFAASVHSGLSIRTWLHKPAVLVRYLSLNHKTSSILPTSCWAFPSISIPFAVQYYFNSSFRFTFGFFNVLLYLSFIHACLLILKLVIVKLFKMVHMKLNLVGTVPNRCVLKIPDFNWTDQSLAEETSIIPVPFLAWTEDYFHAPVQLIVGGYVSSGSRERVNVAMHFDAIIANAHIV